MVQGARHIRGRLKMTFVIPTSKKTDRGEVTETFTPINFHAPPPSTGCGGSWGNIEGTSKVSLARGHPCHSISCPPQGGGLECWPLHKGTKIKFVKIHQAVS